MDLPEFVVGDLVRISCEPLETTVRNVTAHHVVVKWPWGAIDPKSKYRWDGTVALPRDPDSWEWLNTPWRTEPNTSELTTGDFCWVGIPPTEVRVHEIKQYDPPEDTGSIPRPTLGLSLVPLKVPDHYRDPGYRVYLDGREPISLIRTKA